MIEKSSLAYDMLFNSVRQKKETLVSHHREGHLQRARSEHFIVHKIVENILLNILVFIPSKSDKS